MRCTKGIVAQRRVGGGFNPTDIDWYSLQWAGGAEMVALGLSNGDPISNWPNEADGEDALSSGSARPLYITSGIGGQPSVYFDGVDDLVRHSNTLSPGSPDVSQPFTIVLIGEVDGTPYVSSSTGNYFFDGRVSTVRLSLITDSSGRWRMAGSAAIWSSTGIADNDPHLFVMHFDGSSSEFDVDNITEGTGNAGGTNFDGLTIGNHYDSSFAVDFEGRIALVGIKAGDIRDDPLWPDFVDWVGTHYGIPM